MIIPVLLTCHNRKEMTVNCLRSLKESIEAYNSKADERIEVEVFLTDDGCTDGTSDSARDVFPDNSMLHILQGDGNLFWAGGMRFAWAAALKERPRWDYYLLVNDDTTMLPCLFDDLFKTDAFCLQKYGKHGLYTGFIRDPKTKKVSFGGSTDKMLKPEGEPVECTSACANVMFFHQDVVDKIGTFDARYIHAGCDYDYSRMAVNEGVPVITTYSFVGECENEHRKDKAPNLMNMSFSQRKKYLYKPTTGRIDYLLYINKFWPRRYIFTKMTFLLELYCPRLSMWIVEKRRKRITKNYEKIC